MGVYQKLRSEAGNCNSLSSIFFNFPGVAVPYSWEGIVLVVNNIVYTIAIQRPQTTDEHE